MRKTAREMGLVTKKDAALAWGTSHGNVDYHIEQGMIPGPTHQFKARLYYSHSDVSAIAPLWVSGRLVRSVRGEYSLHEAAKMLGTCWDTLRQVGSPSIVRGRRRYYTPGDLELARAALGVRSQTWQAQREEAGHISARTMAKLISVPEPTFWYHRKRGFLPVQAHQVGCYKYYSASDVEALRLYFSDKKNYCPNPRCGHGKKRGVARDHSG